MDPWSAPAEPAALNPAAMRAFVPLPDAVRRARWALVRQQRGVLASVLGLHGILGLVLVGAHGAPFSWETLLVPAVLAPFVLFPMFLAALWTHASLAPRVSGTKLWLDGTGFVLEEGLRAPVEVPRSAIAGVDVAAGSVVVRLVDGPSLSFEPWIASFEELSSALAGLAPPDEAPRVAWWAHPAARGVPLVVLAPVALFAQNPWLVALATIGVVVACGDAAWRHATAARGVSALRRMPVVAFYLALAALVVGTTTGFGRTAVALLILWVIA